MKLIRGPAFLPGLTCRKCIKGSTSLVGSDEVKNPGIQPRVAFINEGREYKSGVN